VKRLPLTIAVAVGVALLVGCSSNPEPSGEPLSTRPAGMSSDAEQFLGGAWATKPTEGCDNDWSAAKTYCWTVEVGHDTACEKRFAFEWQWADEYGDVKLTGRERLKTMGAGEYRTVPFNIFTKSSNGAYTPSVCAGGEATVTSARCI